MTNILFLCINIILFLFCLYFFLENKKLKQKMIELEKENKEILERKIIKNSNADQISIQMISKEQQEEVSKEFTNSSQKLYNQSTIRKEKMPINPIEKKEIPIQKPKSNSKQQSITNTFKNTSSEKALSRKENPPKNDIEKKIPQTYFSSNKKATDDRTKLYQKSLSSNHSNITSPVSISNRDLLPKQGAFDMNKLTLDLNEFIKKSEKVVPKIQEKPKNSDYLKEISNKMADELKPQTIELTDYEKAQEEHAIISYQELLAVKDKLTILDDDEETIDFIEELKYLRNGLKENNRL